MNLNRRDAVKLSIVTYLTTLSSGATGQALSDTKVIVVGAGPSGLAAAHELQAHGVEAVVLESGSCVGGRVRTDMSLGVPFEFGTGWIHGPSSGNRHISLPNRSMRQQS